MLTACGISKPTTAAKLAAAYSFEHCQRHAVQWHIDRDTNPQLGPGTLAYRIEECSTPPAVRVAHHFVQQFKRNWPTAEEQAEKDRWAEIMDAQSWTNDPANPENQKPESESAPRPVVAIDAIDLPDQTLWTQALAQLAPQMTSATYHTWVRDTVLLEQSDDHITIGAPNDYARAWLDGRLRPTIKRTVGGILKRSVQVDFRVMAAA